jgi:hypothetical protein
MHRFLALLTPVFLFGLMYGVYVAYEHSPELLTKAQSSWDWAEEKVTGPTPAPALPSDERATYTRPRVQHFELHKKFSIAKSVKFEFQVPPHVSVPKFSGSFESYAGGEQPGSVDFLLLKQEQYQQFQHGGGGDAVESVEQASAHESNLVLSPTFDQPQTYYILFRNSQGGPLMVKADFTASFTD